MVLGIQNKYHTSKSQNMKINTVSTMELSKNIKQLRDFIGIINYYRDMWS